MLRKKESLSEKYATKAYELFEKKKWKVEYCETERSVFDCFCDRLAMLDNDEQRDLILELTEDYLKITLKDYEALLIEVWKEYLKNNKIQLNSEERFCICPILIEADFKKQKSCTAMLYLCGSLELRSFGMFADEQIRLCSTPEALVRDIVDKEVPLGRLVLIDDYIGSGETALECIEYIKKNHVDVEKVDVLSLVAQEEAINNLEKENVKVYAAVVRKKGISDKYAIGIVEKKKCIMHEIEDILKVDSKYSFGFNQTEALISLIKTPNNTFPVYWYENNSIKSKAPFPRKENIKML